MKRKGTFGRSTAPARPPVTSVPREKMTVSVRDPLLDLPGWTVKVEEAHLRITLPNGAEFDVTVDRESGGLKLMLVHNHPFVRGVAVLPHVTNVVTVMPIKLRVSGEPPTG